MEISGTFFRIYVPIIGPAGCSRGGFCVRLRESVSAPRDRSASSLKRDSEAATASRPSEVVLFAAKRAFRGSGQAFSIE